MIHRPKIFLLCLPFITSSAFADYQVEVNGGLEFENTEFERSNEQDQNTLKVSGIYYLKPISTMNDDPLEELAFLQKASWGSVGLTNVNEDSNSSEKDSTFAVFNGRYVLPDNLYFAETTFQIGGTDSIDIGLGRYLDDKTTVQANYSIDGDDLITAIDVSFKRIMPLATTQTVRLEASIGRSEFNEGDDSFLQLGGAAQYYLNRQLGFGAELAFSIGDVDAYTLGVNGKFFLTEQFAISASFTFIDAEVEGSQDRELSTFDLALTGRF